MVNHMELLKKKNWWLWLILFCVSGGSCTIFLYFLLGDIEKDAWYANWRTWLIGFLCLVIPGIVMMLVFWIQMMSQAAAKLDVPLKELYLSPFIWLSFLIIPVLGWILFLVTILYLNISILVMLYKGKGENYLNF